jgi:predicted DNA-binding helix-hairpin-helix protein
MGQIRDGIIQNKEEKALFKKVPQFATAGQSTQLIVGASDENDLQIIKLSDSLYQGYGLKRVYYSGYVPVTDDARLPQVTQPPMVREHRLYQTDWLMRFYGFEADEILDPAHPYLDLEVDPKLAWALRNRHLFPIDVNTADKAMLLRIPGVGARSVERIVQTRRFGPLTAETLKQLGVVMRRAKHFLTCRGSAPARLGELDEQQIRRQVLFGGKAVRSALVTQQLDLFAQAG